MKFERGGKRIDSGEGVDESEKDNQLNSRRTEGEKDDQIRIMMEMMRLTE